MAYVNVIIYCPRNHANELQVYYDPPEPSSDFHPGSDLEVFIEDTVQCKCGITIHPSSAEEQAEKYIEELYAERKAGV